MLLAGTFSPRRDSSCSRSAHRGGRPFSSFVNAWLLAGLVAYALGTLLWIYALSKVRLTVVYPFTALTFVLVYLFGVLILHEPTTGKALAGVALVLGGLFLISTA